MASGFNFATGSSTAATLDDGEVFEAVQLRLRNPGADEDARGEPFVGQAGRLLDSMLAAIRLKRGENVYIANVVKCRPPGNRNPEPAEARACEPFLERQIALLRPRLIVALGRVAASNLLRSDAPVASLRHGLPLDDWKPEDCLAVLQLYAWGLADSLEVSLVLSDLIKELGGEATVFVSQLADAGDAEALIEQFRRPAREAYREVLKSLAGKDRDLAAAAKRYQQLQAQDYFACELADKVRAKLLAARGGEP